MKFDKAGGQCVVFDEVPSKVGSYDLVLKS